jgi:hypothetical protein
MRPFFETSSSARTCFELGPDDNLRKATFSYAADKVTTYHGIWRIQKYYRKILTLNCATSHLHPLCFSSFYNCGDHFNIIFTFCTYKIHFFPLYDGDSILNPNYVFISRLSRSYCGLYLLYHSRLQHINFAGWISFAYLLVIDISHTTVCP